MSNSKLDRRALASEVKATTAVIFHELDTQKGQGVPVLCCGLKQQQMGFLMVFWLALIRLKLLFVFPGPNNKL